MARPALPLFDRLPIRSPGIAPPEEALSYLMAPFMPFGKKLFADAVAPR